MSGLEFSLDASAIARLGNMIAAAGHRAPVAIARAVNHTGDKARTQMIRALTPQTGLKRKVIVRALKVSRAAQQGSLTYTITSRGGDIRAKFFGPRETLSGVVITPRGQRVVLAGSFTKGGRFPNRVALNMGGQVLKREGKGRTPLQTQKSGVIIPVEMVKGGTEAAFYDVVERDLGDRLAHELARVLGAS